MTTKRPKYRVTFCPIEGKDEQGRDKISKRSTEIGAVWETQSRKSAILRLKLIPENLANGVIFLNPVSQNDKGFA